MLSLRVAVSLTVFRATLVSWPSCSRSVAIPSYTIPKEPWPSSRSTRIFSRGTSHSSGMYTGGESPRKTDREEALARKEASRPGLARKLQEGATSGCPGEG